MASTAPRFASVDALRGVAVAAMLLVNTPGDWGHVYAPLEHAAWNGFTPTDLIFPLFLFVVGVSIALGIVPRLEHGDARTALGRGIAVRAARIVALGLALNLAAWLALDHAYFRPWGVLQRIGLCFLAAGVMTLRLRAHGQWIAILVLLLGYWAVLAFGGTAQWINPVSRLDTAMLGPMVYAFDAASGRGHDPEGLLSTLPAIATTLLGVRAGAWLRADRAARMWIGGLVLLALGALWAQVLPLNKNLWTPSYVLWAGGWAMLALAACHQLVDRRGWPALGRRFGVNAVAAYAGSVLMVYAAIGLGWWDAIYRVAFAGWMTPRFGPWVPSLAFALAFVALWWSVLYAMDRRGWRITI